ncbi:polysaccharide pyruvyl transferase family protein [Rhizobium sp. ARZ01]|uniref:polysaccharide pyruvyl transferase family protein n=1 Tax=Rhizobium sp. ARZ01 TaxID=2769313 RepID=UPI001783EBF1|nr:polysaccharide pyruvyl transferase family protein [Rhizobium sp. ARZ01]MBD9375304.1 polysaccharide pyruvyl transferase family protein [Rhizobium sp. ARZ01]
MKPYYWESQHGNFGDDLNLWLWDFLLPGFRDVHPDTLLVGVGTVLNEVLLPEEGRKLVLGSGFGYGALPDMSDTATWDIRCVRGPLTAQKIGIDEKLGIIDPAVMVADMPEFRHLPKAHRKSFVPHWESTIAGLWPEVCATVGVNYIDPRGDAKEVIAEIARSEMIIAESMHGAILADAFRVPWVAVSTSPNINSFKWNDWTDTVGVTYRPCHVPVSSRAEAIIKGTRFWGVEFEPQRGDVDEPQGAAQGELLVRERSPRRKTLRSAAKQMLAAPSALALWQAGRTEPQLSADGALSERKERFLTTLDGVRRDYF